MTNDAQVEGSWEQMNRQPRRSAQAHRRAESLSLPVFQACDDLASRDRALHTIEELLGDVAAAHLDLVVRLGSFTPENP